MITNWSAGKEALLIFWCWDRAEYTFLYLRTVLLHRGQLIQRAAKSLTLTNEQPGSYWVLSTQKQKLQSSVLFKHKYWIWFYFMFHSVLQFLSENPTLYGLVIEQRPIFGPQGASWNIFRLFPHYSLKIWQEKRWR